MAKTIADHAAEIREDERKLHTERVRVVLEYRSNGHKIVQSFEDWIELQPGDTRAEAEIEALQKALDKREK